MVKVSLHVNLRPVNRYGTGIGRIGSSSSHSRKDVGACGQVCLLIDVMHCRLLLPCVLRGGFSLGEAFEGLLVCVWQLDGIREREREREWCKMHPQ